MNIYAIYALVAISLFCGGFVSGCQHQQASEEKSIREKEHQYQSDADKIRKEKDAQIANINNQLADALVSLRSRPNRATEASNGKDGTGLSLSAEDAIFLTREAARADGLRTALEACYQQYDSIK
jgi:hypothetical protein